MNAYEFYKKYGRDHCKLIAEDSGTTLEYFLQLAYKQRRPSRKLAVRLEESSKRKMKAVELLLGD
jgi:hypothetical protein